jgi:hypothetical protein
MAEFIDTLHPFEKNMEIVVRGEEIFDKGDENDPNVEEVIYTVKTKITRTCHLAGQDFFFGKRRDPETGKHVPKVYRLSSKKVNYLSEVVKKLTNPLNQTVEILDKKVIMKKAKPKK